MKVTMMLADAAQVYDGKLSVLGAGWTHSGPGAVSMAIAMLIDVPWEDTNVDHKWEIKLIDTDNNPVLVPTHEGKKPCALGGGFKVGRPPDHPPGAPITIPIALNMGLLPIPPGKRYIWQLWINGETSSDWHLAFNIRMPR